MPPASPSTSEHTPSAPHFRPLSRVARHLTAAGLIGAIFLALLEAVGRIVDPFGVSYYPETASYLDTLIIENPIGYRHRPGLTGRFWGTEVSINALGLRDREISLQPAEDEFRILMLGDSVVFGLGVEDEDTIPRRIEQQLNESHDVAAYRVINMGVPSYNSEQELEQLRTLGFSLNPDMVVLLFSLNDLQPKMWVLNRRDSWIVNIAQRSYALSLLSVLYWETRSFLTGHDVRAPYEHEIQKDPGWPMVRSSLAEIAHLCEERHIPFLLVLQSRYPALERLADDLAVPVAILEPLDDGLTISLVNSHPNPAGTERISASIAKALQKLGVGQVTSRRRGVAHQ